MSSEIYMLRPEFRVRPATDPEEEKPNPKCVSCKCYWKPDYDDMKSSGVYYKSCRRCRKPKMTAEQIREKDRERARLRREKMKAEIEKDCKH